MGVYDSFCGRCAKCGAEIEIQTKFFDCYCAMFNPGDKVTLSSAPNTFSVTDDLGCSNCGAINMAVIRDRIFLGMVLSCESLLKEDK